MSDIFHEIDEEVRQDQLKQLWDRWGLIFVGGVTGIILAWTGWILWREHVEATRAAESTALEAAVLEAETNGEGALAAFERIVAEAGPGYAAIAAFRKSGLLQEQGRRDEALEVYAGIAADDAVNARLRGLASLMASMTLIELERGDEARARLQALAVEGSEWTLTARELLALLDFEAGDLDAAESGYNGLNLEARAPSSMRQRAREMLEMIDSRRAIARPGEAASTVQKDTAPAAPEVTAPAAPAVKEDGS